MNEFKLIISSPNGNIFEDNIVKLVVRGTEGDLAVLAGHIPFMTAVKAGDCKIEMKDGTEKSGKTDGGILTVSKDKVIFMCSNLDW